MIFPGQLMLDLRELTARLDGMDPEAARELVARCDGMVRAELRPAYAYRQCPVRVEGAVCDFGFAQVQSQGLSKVLSGAGNAVFFAVTLGAGVDRLLLRLSATSELTRYVCDAIASAYAEALAEAAQAALPYPTGQRYSPGYGDFDLSFQKTLLPYVDAARAAGITLSAGGLMTPAKSISAVMRIYDDTGSIKTRETVF